MSVSDDQESLVSFEKGLTKMRPGELSSLLLRLSSEGGEARKVEKVLAAGAYCDPCDNDRRTALMLSIRAQDEPMARLLLKAGASVHAVCKDGHTPLSLAASILPGLTPELLALGARAEGAGVSPWLSAVRGGEPRVLEWLAEAGANPTATDERGEGVFHKLSARLGWRTRVSDAVALAMGETALALGAEPDQPDAVGWTPLHYAAALGDFCLGLWLLKQGACPLRKCGLKPPSGALFSNMSGMSALEIARVAASELFSGPGCLALADALAAAIESLEIDAITEKGLIGQCSRGL